MQQTIDSLRNQFLDEISQATTSQFLDDLKVQYLGRKGPIQELMKSLKDVSSEERPEYGKLINDLKVLITEHIESKREDLFSAEESVRLKDEVLDVTEPGRRRFSGRKHVVLQVLDEVIDILVGMGFSVQYGPDIETDWYNFESLNFPEDHPARDMQDTFYIEENILLRTHTSNVQTRIMESSRPPIRVIAPGKVYRNEEITARSHVFFHQIEGFYIDTHVTFADLLATMDELLSKLFKKKVETRYRPSYFPFVEPGLEVDVRCLSCNGGGCAICKHTGWLEVAGAGMIHPEVLKNGDIDPEVYSGYAWGFGIERLVMLLHGVNDIRYFTENDVRLLSQFSAM